MPHLSPMNWIMAVLMFWTLIITLSTKSWWTTLSTMPFKISYKISKPSKDTSWKWYW